MGEHVAFHSPVTIAFVALAVAAGATERIRLLSCVTLLPLYPATVIAKLAAELAVHSRGRFELGVGIGGEYPQEFEACGVALGERAARAEETLALLPRLIGGRRVSFAGRFNKLREIEISPSPDVPPPVWMGGRKRAAMERAARHADVWMPYLYSPEQFHESMEVVRDAAAGRGRDPDAVAGAVHLWSCVGEERPAAVKQAAAVLSEIYGADMQSVAERYVLAGTPEECCERLAAYRDAGVERFIFAPLAARSEEQAEMLTLIATAVMPPMRNAERPPDPVASRG
jgi:alkanesulfonate monooxygenase SsuD/methylene tetrahydromethanopterin reductase-like flavin-dependent oxidoreductase (luciferase family)